MTLILLLFISYFIVGACSIPFFINRAYKEILSKNQDYPNDPLQIRAKQTAARDCQMLGVTRALLWPVSYPMYFATRPIFKDIEQAQQAAAQRAETERILREYQENDPVNKAFKQLEAEETARKFEEHNKKLQNEITQLNKNVVTPLKNLNYTYASGGYIEPEYETIHSMDGTVLRTYTTGEVPPLVRLREITNALNAIENRIKGESYKYRNGTISKELYQKRMKNLTDSVQKYKQEINEIREKIKH